MVGCKYSEVKDITTWHGDVFDHPQYQQFCNLHNREITRYTCPRCKDYIPCCRDMTDREIEFELWCIDKELEADDRFTPRPSSFYERLLKEKKCLLEEKKERIIVSLTKLYAGDES